MALLNRVDALCAPPHSTPRRKPESEEELPDLSDFEAEMQRLSAANQELLESAYHEPAEVAATAVTPSEGLELDLLRRENADLKARVEELEALTSGQAEKLWRERQREYEMLLEEKSEVIRALHQQLQEVEESVSLASASSWSKTRKT
jgi:hypothetical protein